MAAREMARGARCYQPIQRNKENAPTQENMALAS
jgi:hypothetical protein